MHERYINEEIKYIWSDDSKLHSWLETELAVIVARENLGQIPKDTANNIILDLKDNPICLEKWRELDSALHHDLNAFIEERRRFIRPELQKYFHQGITSYDTEEPAFVRMLRGSAEMVVQEAEYILDTLAYMSDYYRYTPMMARTHGQEAQLQSFGKRCLCWRADMELACGQLDDAANNLRYSKLSGAVGNYGGLDSKAERAALEILELDPFYGATQIMPRVMYQPVANALCNLVCVCNKIALDIRLGARSGRPLYHEPFGKQQMGSSAMPHKKNTILTEQMEGMARMAKGYLLMITSCIETWEERAIEQSCVERVAWPDLFHVAMRVLTVMNKVLSGLVVYPDNMMLEIIESCGCYASNAAKEFLKERAARVGLSVEDCYRIVQLAAFNAQEPCFTAQYIREQPRNDWVTADQQLHELAKVEWRRRDSIENIIAQARLKPSAQLEMSKEAVKSWNEVLRQLFDSETLVAWHKLFDIELLLQGEEALY